MAKPLLHGEIKNIFFDLDGTLIEPKEGILNSLNYALEKMGLPQEKPGDIDGFIGPPLIDSFSKRYQMNEADALRAAGHYRDFFREKGIHQNSVYPGIQELLHLAGKKYQLFVATSKPTVFARQILDHFNLSTCFTGITGSKLDHSRRDKTDIIRYILDRYAVEPQQTIMVGDRKFDVEGAKANGLLSIGVTYGHGSREELLEAGADFVVGSPGELRDTLIYLSET